MDDTEGISNSPSWSPNADQIPYAYTECAWGADLDTSTIGLEWNQDWLEETSLNSESPQTASNASGDSLQYQPGTNFSGECDESGVYTTNEVEGLSISAWNNLNEILDLPNFDDLDNVLSMPLMDMNGNITNSLSSLDYSIDSILPTTSTDLLANNIHGNPFPATFNHTEAQQAYESYPINWDTHLPILDNTAWDSVQSSLYINSSTEVHPPSISSTTLSPVTTNSEIISSPTQCSNTNTSISTSQSNFKSTTPSSDRSISNSPPSTQNEYTCTICSKTFSKRFEFNKHKPIHTLPHTCTLCPRRTARRRDMVRHIAVWHKDVVPSGPKPVSKPTCPVEGCKQGFARSDHLLRHLRRKHPEYDLRS